MASKTKLITELTPTQRALHDEMHARALAYGMSCEPADRPRSEAAMRGMYARMKRPEPKKILWLDGPAAVCLLLSAKQTDLWSSLWDSLRASLGSSLWSSLWDSLRDSLGGQHDLYWITYYHYFGTLPLAKPYSPKDVELLGWWGDIGESCGWWWPRERAVVACERPLRQCLDDRRRLHSEEGPAIECRDGWKVWAINGVRLDQDGEQIVLRPDTQTIEQIDAEKNSEVRRVRIERFGWDRYLFAAGAELVESADDVDGIHQALFATHKGERLLCCACPSTARTYSLEVNPECATIEQAQQYLLAPEAALENVSTAEQIKRVRPLPVCQS